MIRLTFTLCILFSCLLVASTPQKVYEAAIDSMNNKKYTAAEQLLQQLIQEYPQNDTLLAQSFVALAQTYRKQNKTDMALLLAYWALQTATECLPTPNEHQLKANNEVGLIYNKTGRFALAKPYFLTTIFIAEKLPQNQQELATAYKNMAAIYQREPNYPQAVVYCQKALNIYQTLNNQIEIAKSKISLAIAQKSLRQIKIAQQIYQDIINNPNTLPEQRSIAYNNIADIYFEQEDTLKALNIFIQTKNFLENQNQPTTDQYKIIVYKNIGELYLAKHQTDSALNYLQKVLALNQKLYENEGHEAAKIFTLVGDSYLQIDSLQQALQHYQNALKALIKDYQPQHINQQPNDQQLTVADPDIWILVALRQKATAYSNLYETSKDDNYLALAHQTYQLALHQLKLQQTKVGIDEEATAFLIDNEYTIYQSAIAIALRKNDVETAFLIAEQSKANLLNNFLKQAQLLKREISTPLVQQYNHLRQQIIATEAKLYQENSEVIKKNLLDSLFALNQKYQYLAIQIEQQNSNYQTAKYEQQPLTLHDIKNKLIHNKQTAIISYFMADSLLYTFVATKNNINYTTTPIEQNLTDQITKFRLTLSKDSTYYNKALNDYDNQALYNDFIYYANHFYQILLKQATDKHYLDNIDQLIIVPDGILSYIPFEALIKQLPTANTIKEKQYAPKLVDYLIKHYTISYSYSLNTLIENTQRQTTINSHNNYLIAFAPIFTASKENKTNAPNQTVQRGCKANGHLEELKNSYIEVNYINSIANGKVFLEDSATTTNFRKNAHKSLILHLSSHACLNDQEPNTSKIYFANDNDGIDNDYIETHEIYNIPFNTKLVVLSACQTGVGNIVKGEGMMSLARGFMYGGTPSVVASLWSVNDYSTSQIMKLFYTQLFNKKDIDQALKQAKLDYLNTLKTNHEANPFLWAGFICIGATTAPIQQNTSQILIIAIITLSLLAIIIAQRLKKQ
ncbi:MAG: CHAT domain-containing protein [Chitinophagales bacterium]|nr:CHAT domain-containing protein [Chitinophagales bacterium]